MMPKSFGVYVQDAKTPLNLVSNSESLKALKSRKFLIIFFGLPFLGTNFSTLVREGKLCKPKDALDQEAPWVSQDGSITIPSHQVAAEMQEIGSALALLQLSKFQHHI